MRDWVRVSGRYLCGLLILSALLLVPAADIVAQAGDLDGGVHIVQPGETLGTIARRYGLEMHMLLAMNDLADPRDIYPGQPLHWLRPVDSGSQNRAWAKHQAWTRHPVSFGEDWLTLSQQARMSWKHLVRLNRQLKPSLLVGQAIDMPPYPPLQHWGVVRAAEPLLLIALRNGVSVWSMRYATSYPPYTGAPLLGLDLVDDVPPSDSLPYPWDRLDLFPQPVTRGETVILAFETVVPVTCQVTYLDQVAPCFGGEADGKRWYALVGLPALLEPGLYEIGVYVRVADAEGAGSEVGLSLPLLVSAGRFGFERIDLPPSRQGLSSSDLAQVERVKIADARRLRSSIRYWQIPFDFPLQAEVSSYYGSRRSYGGTTFNTYHAGVDLNTSEGTPIQAPNAGMVVLAETFAVRGKVVVIDHGWGVLSGYWHLSHIEAEVGQAVARGQVIGRVGNTGSSTGPHLHWEMWVNGVAVDPLQWVVPFSAGWPISALSKGPHDPGF